MKKLYFILIVIILCRFFFSFYIFNFKYNDGKYYKLNVCVLDKVKEDENYVKYLVKLNNTFLKQYFILKVNYDDNEMFKERFLNYSFNDVLIITSKINIPKKLNNINEFNYKLYLNSKNIIGILNVKNVKYIGTKFSIFNYLFKFKERINDYIDFNLLKYNELFKSLIYGNDINLGNDIKDKFNSIGLSHILSISGSNIVVISLFLSYLLKFLNKENEKVNIYLQIIFIILFNIFCFNKISLTRATIMFVIFKIIKLYNFKVNKYFVLIITFFIMYFLNPYVIFSVSFIFSFLAVFSLILLYNRVNSYFNVKILMSNDKILVKIFKYFNNIISIFISVNIIILPMQIYFFNSFSLLNIFSSIFTFSLSEIIIIIGTCYLFLYRFPFLNNILINLIYLSLDILNNIINLLNSINVKELTLTFPKPNFVIIFIYYLVIYILFFSDELCNILRYKLNKKIDIKLIKNIIIIFLIGIIVMFNIYKQYFSSFVYYFNVGQGNMSIIKDNNLTILVDFGSTSNEYVDSILINFLKEYNIKKIDYLCITHFHEDHVNGISSFCDNFKIFNVIFPNTKNIDDNNLYTKYFKEFDKYGINKIMISENDEIKFNNNINLRILNYNDKNKILSKSNILNSNSAVYLFNIKNSKYLYMGDATYESENYLLKNSKYLNNIKVLQVGHHGSKTSSSNKFLEIINPKYSIISSFKRIYGHPSKVTIDRFKNYELKYYITENDGGKIFYLS